MRKPPREAVLSAFPLGAIRHNRHGVQVLQKGQELIVRRVPSMAVPPGVPAL